MPCRQFFARSAERKAAKLGDEAKLFGERHKIIRRQKPSFGMVPPHQRLEAAHAAVFQRHDRLVIHFKLFAFERMAQIRFNTQPVVRVAAHIGFENFDFCFAVALSAEHGDFGFGQQFLRHFMAVFADGDTDRGGGEHFLTADFDGLRQELRQGLGKGQCVLTVRARCEQDREFVAVDAGDRVFKRDERFQSARDGDEQGIAAGMAEVVVDDFETVNVNEQQRGTWPVDEPRAPDGAVQPVHEQGAVGQTRQAVVNRVVEETFLGQHTGCDVAHGADAARGEGFTRRDATGVERQRAISAV